MRIIPFIITLFIITRSHGQNKSPGDYGFRHLQTIYKGDTVDILIRSKKGDEQKKKPLFLFCQGSLPIPLIITYKDSAGKTGIYNVFVFNPDSLAIDYHLVIINKPYIPLMIDQGLLTGQLTYTDSTGSFPAKYIERNLLDYYVGRNIAVIKFLQGQQWVSNSKLVVAGHSEGGTVAAKIAYSYPKVTQLIYSGGNPCGRILSMIEQQRARESDSARYGEQVFNNWKSIVDDPANMNASNGDAYKTTYSFSIPAPMNYLEKLRIPVLFTYGTRDYSCPFNDYFRVKTIEQKRTNFSFRAYIDLEHNFFPMTAHGAINYDIFNWDKVADDWRQWLKD
jgi:hypothetical protein